MDFIRKPLWALFALLALSYQPAQAMEGEDQVIDTAIKIHILKKTFISQKTDKSNFRDIGINLSLVCKNWRDIINQNAKNWVCDYFNIEKKHKDDFWRYFKGKLVYTNVKGDNRQVFYFSAAPNPFKHTFHLPSCDDAGNYQSYHLGTPEEDKESAEKVQTWIFFSPHVANQLETTAQHLKPIFPVEVPVCILWTWGNCNDPRSHDYLTTKSMDKLSKYHLYRHWRIGASRRVIFPCWWLTTLTRFQVLFVK